VQAIESFRPAFSGKRILVTGHTGFKGAWLSAWLLELGAEVTGFSLPSTGEEVLFDQLGLHEKLTDVRSDIRDESTVAQTLATARPQVIFHLAAQPIVRRSYRQPIETFAVNVMGTAHLLEACRAFPEPCVVICVTSDKCYQNRESLHAYIEEDPLGGHDPYSASKAAAELIIASYRDSFFGVESPIRLASARAGNVIGGGDWADDRLVSDSMRALQKGAPLRVRNPASTRPWQHVLEPLSGYLQLAAALLAEPQNRALASAFNFGPDPASSRTVRDLVETILQHWPATWEDASDPSAPHEARNLNLATGKALRLLDWKPVWTFEETVRHTVEWYRLQSQGAPAWDLCLEQIRAYVADSRQAAPPVDSDLICPVL
jgi:CDP-glucose 4,6-dehydratase